MTAQEIADTIVLSRVGRNFTKGLLVEMEMEAQTAVAHFTARGEECPTFFEIRDAIYTHPDIQAILRRTEEQQLKDMESCLSGFRPYV